MDAIVYFASDFHLGINNSKEREQKVIKWLEEISKDATHLLLLGDLFDYWFEYRHYVPKGYVRFLGKLAELRDQGIEIHIFTGNHDIWMFDYFPAELDIPIHKDRQIFQFNGRQLWVGHGDGKGPGDKGYKRLKKIFHNPFVQFLYRQLHPDLTHQIAGYFSQKSREQEATEVSFLGKDQEWLIQYCEKKLTINPEIDYFIFGHRHLPIYYELSNEKSIYINTGHWFTGGYFACLRAENCYLYSYETGEKLFPEY